MLRAQLKDAALALAKERSHERVEPRHVWLAVARMFRDVPQVQEILPQAKRALDPKGTSYSLPIVTPEVDALLSTLKSDGDAIAGLLKAFNVAASENSETPSAAESTATTNEIVAMPPDMPAAAKQRTPVETTASVLAELESLIGLDAVKRQVKRLIAVVQANTERERAGLVPVNPGLHLVFSGPPGTGKTTVARIVARLYASTGALPGRNFTEASRADLVAGYVGQTALKTTDVIKRTSPGVLFIDEAYSLTPRHESDFGAEAVATIVKAMEDHRKKLAIIVAGYGEEMTDFVQSNPGLKSRFSTTITFPDYTPNELGLIFTGFAKTAGIGLAPGAVEKASSIFKRVSGREDFGNARFARTLFEAAYARMSSRAAEDGRVELHELMEITANDVDWDDGEADGDPRRIGFMRGK